jgi:hypothetical protein
VYRLSGSSGKSDALTLADASQLTARHESPELKEGDLPFIRAEDRVQRQAWHDLGIRVRQRIPRFDIRRVLVPVSRDIHQQRS